MNQENDGFVVLISLIGAFVLWTQWDSVWVLSARFKVNEENVLVERKPRDCEFLTAPIGRKHCSYETVYEKTQAKNRQDRFLYVSFKKNLD
jgi:hypothetical protein